MSITEHVMVVDESTFESAVLERSKEVPVVVDFWAEWCAPCRSLGPVLERLAEEDDGAWILAKLDVDANPQLSAAFGIQGIPAVKAFKDGRQVAEFTGALPEAHVRSWLEQLRPSRADVLVRAATDAETEGRLEEAARLFDDALKEAPGNEAARRGASRVRLALRREKLDRGEIDQRLARDPEDVDALTAAADLDFVEGEVDAAFARLLDAIRVVNGDARDALRLHLLGLFDPLPPDDPRVAAARRSLMSALF